MATKMRLLHPSTNGTKPHVSARVIPLLGGKIDHVAELRSLIRQAQEEERRLTSEILTAMEAADTTRLEGRTATAIRDARTNLKVDVGLFVEALGARAFEALSVNITTAHRLMGSDDLAAIAETITVPVLRIEPTTAAA